MTAMGAGAIEGKVSIAVNWDGREVRAARVVSTRPQGVARLLVGQRAADGVALVPRLFAICGRSQAVAAALACESAAGIEPDATTEAARQALVDAEIVHEHLWRILLDWPRAAGRAGDAPLLARIRGRLAEALAASEWAMRFAPARPEAEQSRSSQSWSSEWEAVRAELGGLLAREILAAPLDALSDPARFEAWLRTGTSPTADLLGRFRDEAADLGATSVPLLPQMTSELAVGELAHRLDGDESFAVAPDWEGHPCETGARARQHAHPLVAGLTQRAASPVPARLAARLVELGELLASPPKAGMAAAAVGAGDAIAWVETARGLLVHRVTLDGERIARYQIVAPTEWNFHPRGALAVELERLRAADHAALAHRIELLVQSLDPCVAYAVEVGHA